ncbi:MAG: cysteine-rich CWC family protein [Burkholderiales bacterium]
MNDDDTCPRCGGGFHCGSNDAAPCACTTITLDAQTLAELRARYPTCLCMTCLVELSAMKKGRPDPEIGRP